jgi:hypothetical protein
MKKQKSTNHEAPQNMRRGINHHDGSAMLSSHRPSAHDAVVAFTSIAKVVPSMTHPHEQRLAGFYRRHAFLFVEFPCSQIP